MPLPIGLQECSPSAAGVQMVGVQSPIINIGSVLAPVIGIQPATPAQNGYLSAADKAKLDALDNLRVREVDGAPNVYPVKEIRVTNGTLTDLGGGVVQLVTGGGAVGWQLTGNAGTNPAVNFVGTTDNQPVYFKVNSTHALRLEPHSWGSSIPVLIAGDEFNTINASTEGSSILGGGGITPHLITASFSTIAGGKGNVINGATCFIGSGDGNTVGSSDYAAILAGLGNSIANGAVGSFVGAGSGNTVGVGALSGVIGGGNTNVIDAAASYTAILGGDHNHATASYAFMGGGLSNTASGSKSVVVGGESNTATGSGAFVGGGSTNSISAGDYAFIGGGDNNSISTDGSVSLICGGNFNAISAAGAMNGIGGGDHNLIQGVSNLSSIWFGVLNQIATSNEAVIVSGASNLIQNANFAFIGGGQSNTVSGEMSAVGGGFTNTVSGRFAAIPGGGSNSAGGDYTLVFGDTNTVDGDYSAAGGINNSTIGAYSLVYGSNISSNGDYNFLFGRRIKNTGVFNGVFSFADALGFDFAIEAPHEFAVRATGGVRLITAIDGGGAATFGAKLDASGHLRIGTFGSPATSAVLDLSATDGAALLPRLTTTQRNALTASAGMVIYNTTTTTFQVYGAAWSDISTPAQQANTVAIDTTLVNCGLRAAGGYANFDTTIKPRAGGTAANTSPLKFTTQVAGLTVVEQGAMELIGNSLQFTQLAKRRGVMMSQSVRVTSETVGNSITESGSLQTAEHGAGYLEVGKCERIVIRGIIAQRSNPSAVCSFRIKYAGATVQTITTPVSTVINANTPFELTVLTTCRSTGATGTMQINAFLDLGAGIAVDPGTSGLATIDTTTAQDTTITAQWGEANPADTLTVEQGYIQCIEPNK